MITSMELELISLTVRFKVAMLSQPYEFVAVYVYVPAVILLTPFHI
jgi:hypothetical protein